MIKRIDTPNAVLLCHARRLLLLPLLTAVLFLSGCSQDDSLSYRYQDYIHRLENVLEQNAEAAPSLEPIAYPDKRVRLQSPEIFEQGLMEVWDFERCGLMQLINQRNSNLGKVMRPSQRYIYENHFWQKLLPCFEQRHTWLKEDPGFVGRLEAVYEHKQRTHPVVIHQLFFAGAELEQQFSQSLPPFPPESRPDYKGVVSALDYLARQQTQGFNQKVTASELEGHLQILNHQPLLHSLLKSLQISTNELNRAAMLLESKLQKRPLCLNHTSTPKAKILLNVLQKYYVQSIQPVIAHHSRMANELLPVLNRIFATSAQGSDLARYQNQWLDMNLESALWQRFHQANLRHTAIWNQALRQCGLLPGSE